MKQAEDQLTRELPVTRRGPKPILGRTMTLAERKERSRLLRAVAIREHFDQADTALRLVRHEVPRMTPELDAALGLVEAELAALRFLCDKA